MTNLIYKYENSFGNRISVKVVKNKMAAPFKKVEVDLIFSHGICKELDLLDASLIYQVTTQSGSWYTFDGQRFAQGREQAFEYLKANPDFTARMMERVVQATHASDVK